MGSMGIVVKPVFRFLAPLAAAGLVMTGVAGGERTASAQEVVMVAPPAPRVELVTVAPSPNHFWAPGYWGYRHGYGHQWYPGTWQAYRPGYTWTQPGWGRGGGGYVFRGGGWGRSGGYIGGHGGGYAGGHGGGGYAGGHGGGYSGGHGGHR
jgi:hypothetical protein